MLPTSWLYLIIFGTQLNRIKWSWYNFIIITHSFLLSLPHSIVYFFSCCWSCLQEIGLTPTLIPVCRTVLNILHSSNNHFITHRGCHKKCMNVSENWGVSWTKILKVLLWLNHVLWWFWIEKKESRMWSNITTYIHTNSFIVDANKSQNDL
jgi:hypothetical protein